MGNEKNKKEIETILENFENKTIIIEQQGFIKSKIFIKNLKYEINYDILKISEESNGQYIIINLNQTYKIENEKNSINIYLDNDMQINIKEMEN